MGGIVVARAVAGLLIAGALVGGQSLRSGVPEPPEDVDLDRVPERLGHWDGRDIEVSDEILEILRPDGFLLREYVSDRELPLQLYVDYHRVQRLGATIHSPRICYPGSGWELSAVEVGTLDPERPGSSVCWLRLRAGDAEMLTAYWYESRWGRSARETHLKLGIVRSAFARRPSDAALLRFATPIVDGNEESARRRIRDFVRAAEPELRQELPFRRRGLDRTAEMPLTGILGAHPTGRPVPGEG
ncbi:MAG TPA: EpsI family protein [bacterium]|nr:EpsI family protein [bacterium]